VARGSGYAKGSRHPKAKLNEAIVAYARSCNDTVGELARRFNVCKKTMRSAKKGVTWKHVVEGTPPI
jgi:hypothetical protein